MEEENCATVTLHWRVCGSRREAKNASSENAQDNAHGGGVCWRGPAF